MIKKINYIYYHNPEKTQELCHKKFSNNPNGCGNFGKDKDCEAKRIEEIIDINKPMYLIMFPFSINEMARKIQSMSTLTYEQARDMQYWKPIFKDLLIDLIFKFQQKHPDYIILDRPQVYGLDVTKTVKKGTGIILNWNYPLNKIWRVALAGAKKERKK
jgi:hypothetical protein